MAFVLLAVILTVIASSDQLHRWLLHLLERAEGIIRVNPTLGVLIFVLFAAASAMLTFVSSAVIIPIGIYTWGQGIASVLLWTGWIVGGMLAYSLSRYLGRPVIKFLKLQALLHAFEATISSRAPFPLILLFQVAMPTELVGYLLGIVRYSFWKYLAALALAELPWALATVYLGSSFLERRTPQLIGATVALALLSALSLRALHRRIVARQESESRP